MEFPGLKEKPEYSESDLESRIIDHLQKFLMETGKGFNFVGRQVRFTFDEGHFAVLRLLMVELTLPKDSNAYASKYELYLPDKKLLQEKLIEWLRKEDGNE